MDNVLDYGFQALDFNEMFDVDGGGWREAGYAFAGVLLIAASPVVAVAPGGGWVAAGMAMGTGITMLGNCKK